jgi:hypothetical protein
MDERLEKALAFANYSATIANQKQNIKNRVTQIQTLHKHGGVFLADQSTIAFVQAMISSGENAGIMIDQKENPIRIPDYTVMLEDLITAYKRATEEFDTEMGKLKKARNLNKVMDW